VVDNILVTMWLSGELPPAVFDDLIADAVAKVNANLG